MCYWRWVLDYAMNWLDDIQITDTWNWYNDVVNYELVMSRHTLELRLFHGGECRVINVLMKHPRDETRNSQKSNDTYNVIIGCASKINNFIKLGVLIF